VTQSIAATSEVLLLLLLLLLLPHLLPKPLLLAFSPLLLLLLPTRLLLQSHFSHQDALLGLQVAQVLFKQLKITILLGLAPGLRYKCRCDTIVTYIVNMLSLQRRVACWAPSYMNQCVDVILLVVLLPWLLLC
jgi:hypothetical protein